jgi:hypothetical protein
MLTATATMTRETLPLDLPVRSVLNVGVDTRPDDRWPFGVKQVNCFKQAISLRTPVVSVIANHNSYLVGTALEKQAAGNETR